MVRGEGEGEGGEGGGGGEGEGEEGGGTVGLRRKSGRILVVGIL